MKLKTEKIDKIRHKLKKKEITLPEAINQLSELGLNGFEITMCLDLSDINEKL